MTAAKSIGSNSSKVENNSHGSAPPCRSEWRRATSPTAQRTEHLWPRRVGNGCCQCGHSGSAFLRHCQLPLAPPGQLGNCINISSQVSAGVVGERWGNGESFRRIRNDVHPDPRQSKKRSGGFTRSWEDSKATLGLRVKREATTSSNVAGVFEGSDPKLKEEAVVFSAHYDAYGLDNGRLYPGAADNALGTATIVGIAEAFVDSFPKPSSRPHRSIIFLAVTGEEYGLFGSEYWVGHPTWPLEKIAADINFDSIGTEVYGPVKRIVGFGAEHSDLGSVFEDAVAATGNIVTPDPMPEENAFVRSDHYAFVKRGVPALMLLGGPAGDVSMWIARARKWLDTDYHSPSDTVKPDWNWTGPETLGEVGMLIGLRIANTDAMPAWRTTSPFNKPRNPMALPRN
jgi:hypothetical protein